MGRRSDKRRTVIPQTACLSQAVFERQLSALGLTNGAAYRAWCREHGFGQGRNKSGRQRREELRCALELARQREINAVMEGHIHDLGLENVAEYADWCRARGISWTWNKNRARRKQETSRAQQERADSALRVARPEERDWEFWLDAIFDGQANLYYFPTPMLMTLHSILRGDISSRTRKVLRYLVNTLGKNSRLLRGEGEFCARNGQENNSYVYGLYGLARQHVHWRRGVEDWKPRGHTACAQFHSLARHLLAEYDVPTFMDRAWLAAPHPLAEQYQDWFIKVGQGCSVRELGLPIPLTRMAAHHFLKAPADLSFEQAMRWGQVRGMGGGERLARTVANTLLRNIQEDEAFWNEVIIWLVHNPELATSQVGAVVDFIFNVKFTPRTVYLPDGDEERLPPPEPEFAMKGRTPAALLRRVEEWHQELAREKERPARAWNGLKVEAWTHEQPSPDYDAMWQWTIRELLDSSELEAEGRAMNNCVASYVNSCVEGESSIWSLRLETPESPLARRVMTIEVDPETRTIVQARGKCNVVPGHKNCPARLKLAPEQLRQWAARAGLRLSPHAW